MKNLHIPPPDVVDVIIAVGIVMGVEPELVKNKETGKVEEHYYEATIHRFADSKFYHQLKELDVDHLPPETVDKIEFFRNRSNFNPMSIAKKSLVASVFCNWILVIGQYLDYRAEIMAEFPEYKPNRSPWKKLFNSVMDVIDQATEGDSDSSDEDFRVGTIKDKYKKSKQADYNFDELPAFDDEMGELFERVEPGHGDEFSSVKPWLGAIKEPAHHPRPVSKAPNENLSIDWVYGYRSEEARQNLHFNS